NSEERLWIGTHGGGLSWFRDGRLISCTSREGLPDDNIWQILDDGAGRLWLGTNSGIVRLLRSELDELADGRRAKGRALTLGRSDGLPTGVCSRGNGARLRSGALAFPTADGIAILDPANFTAPEPPPHIHIEEANVGGTPRGVRGDDSGAALVVNRDEQ